MSPIVNSQFVKKRFSVIRAQMSPTVNQMRAKSPREWLRGCLSVRKFLLCLAEEGAQTGRNLGISRGDLLVRPGDDVENDRELQDALPSGRLWNDLRGHLPGGTYRIPLLLRQS
ncbi:hypothetical protein AVEN_267272-1, partial [Araneus ventricosus]